jgi:DNA-binding transcriptional LysR family regulator
LAQIHSIRQIEVVKALAKHHHFGLAAKALGVSQPALTRSLKQLETELGVSLFDRQGVAPTEFGEIVLRYGERASTELRELMREITLAKGLDIGELRLGVGPYPADISAERAVGALSERHPNLVIELRISNYTGVHAEVIDGSVDLGLADVREVETDSNLDVLPVRACPLVFFCAAGHPLAGRASLGIEDLIEFPWVGPSLSANMRKALPFADKPFGVFDEIQDRFHPRILVETFPTAHRACGKGDRRGHSPPDRTRTQRRVMRDACRRGALAASPLRLHLQTRPVGLARREGVHGDRPGDREGNRRVSATASLEFPQRVR